jgi:hypothetical protein
MLRTHAATNERDLAAFMAAQGLGIADVLGPTRNASNHLVIIYDDGTPAPVDASIGAAGTSVGTADGGAPNTAEVGRDQAVATSDNLGAAVAAFTGTLSNFPAIPGTVEITVTGTGQVIYDDGSGVLRDRSKGDARRRGTINYLTGAVGITFGVGDSPSGNVEADYRWSATPDFTDMPRTVRLVAAALSGFTPATAVVVKVYEDEALAFLRWSGGGNTDAAGDLYLPIDVISRTQETADPTKRGRRWVTITGDAAQGTVSLSWERFGG